MKERNGENSLTISEKRRFEMIIYGYGKPRLRECPDCGFWTRHEFCPKCNKRVFVKAPFNAIANIIDKVTLLKMENLALRTQRHPAGLITRPWASKIYP
jgi:hypothetical protein